MKNRDLEVSKPVRVAFVVELMRLDVQTLRSPSQRWLVPCLLTGRHARTCEGLTWWRSSRVRVRLKGLSRMWLWCRQGLTCTHVCVCRHARVSQTTVGPWRGKPSLAIALATGLARPPCQGLLCPVQVGWEGGWWALRADFSSPRLVRVETSSWIFTF